MQVSWSDSPHVVVMIPGSEEQRGTDLRAALKGHEPFSRCPFPNTESLPVQPLLPPVAPDPGLQAAHGCSDACLCCVQLLQRRR